MPMKAHFIKPIRWNCWSWNRSGCLKPCSHELCSSCTVSTPALRAPNTPQKTEGWNGLPCFFWLLPRKAFSSTSLCHSGPGSKSFLSSLHQPRSLLLWSFYFEKFIKYYRETIKQMLIFLPPNISNILSYLPLIFLRNENVLIYI